MIIPLIKPFVHKEVRLDMKQFMLEKEQDPTCFQKQFVNSLAAYFNDYSMSIQLTSSGTSALHLSLTLEGIGKDDVVFCSNSSFIASVNPILYVNAQPWFIDVDIETGNMSPEHLKKGILEAKRQNLRPKAIIVTHSYGYPAEMESIISIAKTDNLIVIEDAAEAIGSQYKKSYSGTLGDYGIYSFNANKINTTFGGGVLLSKRGFDAKKAYQFITHFKMSGEGYKHEQLGYNYRMNDLACYLGSQQIRYVEKELFLKQKNRGAYRKEIDNLQQVKLFQEEDCFGHNYWMNVLICDNHATKNAIEKVFDEDGIEYRSFWYPLHQQKFLKNYPYTGNQESIQLYQRCLCIPSSSGMSEEEIGRVIAAIRKACTR